MLEIRGRLPPEVGALLLKALQVAAEQDTEQPDSEPSQRLVAALGEVAGAALGEGLARRAGKKRTADYQVLVHVDQEVLEAPNQEGRCETEGGVGVSAETARRLCCDQPVLQIPDAQGHPHEHQHGGPCPLNLGRSQRRPGPALQRAVRARDEGVCQFPGCTNRHYLQFHHIKHWAELGPTELENLTLLCSHHHRAVHEGGFSVQRAEDGELRFFNPQGRRLCAQPPPLELPAQPVRELLRQTALQAPDITAMSGSPTWDGSVPVDYDTAIGWLLELDKAS